MHASIRVAILSIVLIFQTGCLIFSKQTIVVDYPKAGKEARVLLVYEGLRDGGDMRRSRRHLEDLTLNKAFYYGDPILHFEIESGRPSAREKRVRDAIVKHCRIQAGEFWRSPGDSLCYSQSVVIADPDAMMAELNSIISTTVREETAALLAADRETWPAEIDEDTVKLSNRLSSEKAFDWIHLSPGRLSATVPTSSRQAAQMVRGLFQPDSIEGFVKEINGLPKGGSLDPKRTQELQRRLKNILQAATFMGDAPISFDRRHDRMIVSVGYGEGRPIVVPSNTLAMVDKNAGDPKSLIDFARTLKAPFRDDGTTEAAIARFMKR